ncbi:hypothetical protein CRG98_021506 [Punica granatum]|uniref:Uncharacterized protein n=1 Tax=Punica granatum TaxID=22663 RepID=A0A2I0JPC7_PUNGR|nr:hypothetical protein CRG98_021506 [Punica granatum]
MQKSKLARVSRPGKVARGTSEQARRTCGAGKKVTSHRLADPASLQVARAMWLGELAVPENPARLQQARARTAGELAVQEGKLARVSRPGKFARGTSEVARRACGAGNYARTGHQIPQSFKRRARWLRELAMQKSKLARVIKPGKVARGTSELARRTCGARRKVSSHGLADLARLHEAGGRWLGEVALQESKLARKINSHWLEDPARLQEARASWLGELAVQESKLARLSKPGKVARGTSELARRTCGAGRCARTGYQTQQSFKRRARWLRELAMQKSKLARVSRRGKVRRSTSEVARRTCGAGRCARTGYQTQQSFKRRARWLRELAMQKSKLARVIKPGKVARGTSELARRTCGAGKKVCSNRLPDPTKFQEESEVAPRTCDA